ncbi:hypothetical protein DB346_24435 [Verrucomicrobia bacterium LW23]|nr:hypothetical protein DB346_24435 [Verrucomicrobia bacterium LW23]
MSYRLSDSAGYKEAVARELTLRETAFLCDDRTTLANGIRVRLFTPMHMLRALYAESPFVLGGEVRGEELLQFLWIIRDTAAWGDGDDDRQRFIGAHLHLLQPQAFMEAFNAVHQYLEETFMDRPPSASADASTAGEHTAFYSNVAELVDIFGHQYGWTERYVLGLPYVRLYQYLRCIISRTSLEEVSFINRFSDLAAVAWTNALNQQQQAQQSLPATPAPPAPQPQQ